MRSRASGSRRAGREDRIARRRADPVGLRQARAVGASGPRTRSAAWSRASRATPRVTRKLNATVSTSTASRAPSSPSCRTAAGVEVGAAILTTGFTHFDSVNKPEWGFGTVPGRRHDDAGRADDLVGQGRPLPVRRAQAEARRDPALRRLARPPDRPRVVLQDLLHRVGQHRDGDPRGAARLPRLHLLHGYPHLRPLRERLLLAQPGGVQGQVHQGAHRRGDERRQAADRQGRGHAGEAADHDPLRHGRARDRHGPERRQHDDFAPCSTSSCTSTATSRARTPTASWARRRGRACSSPAPRSARRRSTIRSRRRTRRRCCARGRAGARAASAAE